MLKAVTGYDLRPSTREPWHMWRMVGVSVSSLKLISESGSSSFLVKVTRTTRFSTSLNSFHIFSFSSIGSLENGWKVVGFAQVVESESVVEVERVTSCVEVSFDN